MVRAFSGAEPAPDVIERVLKLGMRSPSAGNTQGWDAVVLRGAERSLFWEATTTSEWRGRSRRWPALERAPVVVTVFADPEAYAARYREPDKADPVLGAGVEGWPVPYWYVDAGCALMLMLLGAVDGGVGACLLGNFRGEAELTRALGVPGGRRYVGALLLGAPGGEDPPSSSGGRHRRSFEEVVHFGAW